MSGVCLDGRLHLHVLVKILNGLGQFDTGASGSGYERKKSLLYPDFFMCECEVRVS